MNGSKYHYLPPQTLDSLKNIELVAQSLVEGAITGLHRSPYHGFSTEFAGYRKYCPGDPVRYLDWLVYAKTDRYYIKQFEEETNLRAYVLLDTSGSMSLASQKLHKFNYACYIAAAFMYLFQKQRDAVGLFAFDETIRTYCPAKNARSHMLNMLSMLESLKPEGKTRTLECFHRIAEEIPKRSMIIILSDFFDSDTEFIRSLQHFKYKQCEVILFQILDDLELKFPFKGLIEFEDMETGEVVEVESQDYRDAYLQELENYSSNLRSRCHQMNYAFETLATSSPFERALMAFFVKREEMF